MDHGWPDWKTVQIPDDLEGYESVTEYICEKGWVPTWSERFLDVRVKWLRVYPTKKFRKEEAQKKIRGLEISVKDNKRRIKELQKLVKTLDK